ncbi:MAG: hypothetical protein MUD14_14820 [Hydrococcus sp. Prado102]|jgi:hypothetical protein|nr:hypothetical protein [Hydrococcus sp. Prado102]
MKLKSSLMALVSASALAGASTILFSSEAQACFLEKLKGDANASAPNNSPNLTIKQPDFNKLAIIGGSIVTLAGLSVGGMALKTRLSQGAKSVSTDVPQTEPSTKESFAPPSFAIVVPPEALTASSSIEGASELKHPVTK